MKITDLKNYTVVGGPTHVSVAEQPKGLGQTALDVGSGIANFVGAKGISEQFGADIARATVPKDQKDLVSYPSMKEVVGSAIQTGANFLPGAGVGAKLATKVAVGAGTGYAFDVGSKLQTDKTIPESFVPGLGTAVGAGLPIAAVALKPVTRIVGRLFKGAASGLSGVSDGSIETIIKNPQEALKVSQQLSKSGNSAVLEQNAREIINGVSKIRQEARQAFGVGLEQLSATDIQPAVFREQTQKILDKYGSSLQGGQRVLSNVEFDDPKNIQKASELIDKLSKVDLNGVSLRKLSDDIESAAYKVATSDERLSFNAFVKDLAGSLKESISHSTEKLDEINRAFSQDMQLAEATQNIFGKVNFKNLPEVVRASQKLEGLFNQKGLAPDVVDQFLTRIGIPPSNFRTSEAVRQISNKTSGGNSVGLSLGEITQEITSAVVTPQMVKNLSIVTGLAKETLMPFLQKMKPAARNVLIQALLQMNQEDSKSGL